MGDLGEFWRDVRASRKQRESIQKARSYEKSMKILAGNYVQFESKNNGMHLIVTGKDCLIDFWPTTERFISRDGKHDGFGAKNLLKLC